jgi:hypothetical protein
MTTHAPAADALSRARAALDAPADHCQVLELPPVSYLAIDGLGPPDAPAFTDAVHAVYGISYAVRDALRAEGATVEPLMPLEAIGDRRGMAARGATRVELDADDRPA